MKKITYWQEKETEKAIHVEIEGSDCAGSLRGYKIWLPKSKLGKIEMVNEEKKCFSAIIEDWLFDAKERDVGGYFGREIYLNFAPVK